MIKDDSQDKITIQEHLQELRKRLICSIIVFIIVLMPCYFFSSNIYNILLIPLKKSLDYSQIRDISLIYTDITEVFFVYLKVSILTAIMIAMPFFLWQIYAFIAPGLYKQEKKVFVPYLILTPFLFGFGVFMVYQYIFPIAWQFFLHTSHKSNTLLEIEFMPSVSEYLDLVVQLMIAFGLAFQLPIFLSLSVQFKIISVSFLESKRRLAIVIIFVLASILTPPDVFSQITLAIPMIILYEASILLCKYVHNKKK
ncbi:MAG: twin arginine-targeting protein translocase TatC [Candidatus Xenolissoclinum pacificiensis L6]|uniref:Sec-independent protein translocase protein TatC n=1 Tax=Candidatus Xenolissoclinum pacificiensis L6 TaxID=1401685 RepID=W2V0X4_9RICK|nr:MAG: twin arginine-targeting protein translocase TatC [Candidatus Xenolissoclinum pacificiensis L6]